MAHALRLESLERIGDEFTSIENIGINAALSGALLRSGGSCSKDSQR